jgi:phosphoenolpyruvate synthase/pyruvate phosphate dikinase
MAKKYVYFFGGGKADGKSSMKELLGGKGANLAEMAGHRDLRLPVPPGFTITTEVCAYYYKNKKKYPAGLKERVNQAMKRVEVLMGKGFADSRNPLLVSVRSGARKSMPGMMETVLNVGLASKTIPGLINQTQGNERFVYDAYRRLIMMYSDVVMEKAAGIEPETEDKGIRRQLEKIMLQVKQEKGVDSDTELDAEDLKKMCGLFKERVKGVLGKGFPDEPHAQLWGAIGAVFGSWNGKRAVSYRRIEGIPDEWGTAVNVQTMVFGNLGSNSATGVGFTRNPGNGENRFYGEYLDNAQGEDVVAGIRTPAPINKYSQSEHNKDLPILAEEMPKIYEQLAGIRNRLERHYHDMQDIEFTIENGRLFMLQTRTGKRNGPAAVRMAYEMYKQGLINAQEAVRRVTPNQLDELLHPIVDPMAERQNKPLAKGLPAGPGGATGQIVFSASDAVKWRGEGKSAILLREETNPEDVEGMRAAVAILTARGGMTCIEGSSLLLTNKGFLKAVDLFQRIEDREKLMILSFDTKTMKTVWKNIIAAGKRISDVISISVSQTGHSERNIIKTTPDHKMLTFENMELVKKRISGILDDNEFVCAVNKLPFSEIQIKNKKLAYLAGCIFTDGYINLKRTKGNVAFTQKETEEKKEVIETVSSYFQEVFNKHTSRRTKVSDSYIGDRHIHGEALDLICHSKEGAITLNRIYENIVSWVISLDEESTLNFLAGVIDGDGTFFNSRIQIYVSKENLCQGIVTACLKLNISPQVSVNRDIYSIQIMERLNDILRYTKRVKGTTREKIHGIKLFSIKQLFSHIAEEVNYMGRIKTAIKRNWLFDGKKIKRDILPLCKDANRQKLELILSSDLRMLRAVNKGKKERTFVYNFEVESENEMDKNFIVFTKMYTPLLVSNSHAALVARGWGKCCIVGCGALDIDYENKQLRVDKKMFKEGDWITLNGSKGLVYEGKLSMVSATEENKILNQFLNLCDGIRKLKIRTNADTPEDARRARAFGTEGIGLFRTEHMFYGKGSEKPLFFLRKMIVSSDATERQKALEELFPYVKEDIKKTLEVMEGLPVTIRLIDPPLHEFVPKNPQQKAELAKSLNIDIERLNQRADSLHESNPMMGHRGVRLGITYPEISQMQIRAILEAAAELIKQGKKANPEIMIPVVGEVKELENQLIIAKRVYQGVLARYKLKKIPHSFGTMIEIPRAALLADDLARVAEFFSFGTNDLTQMGFGFSRDDLGGFLPDYLKTGILSDDPFQTIDQAGIGQLIELGIKRGRRVRRDLKVGICGEHGGEPRSIEFCHRMRMDYVSCSPFRIPIARLAAAQAALGK